ncbi:hypothetical protein [Parasporobacterium paucivorans]|uniref:Uncharacterized protein n=1 Tax=Parasporobacterium paucivorans DSM 15970 TaxID=1122934 RepID=A0A1M6HCA7_9FIRM|nr:hypothetical protein [Parasporobacterium paucivorans]SHJ19827.1 hypothetical protein SAMN02745691_01524 [Parasporobacterium paucivorans DSM 15970]
MSKVYLLLASCVIIALFSNREKRKETEKYKRFKLRKRYIQLTL